MLRMWRIGFVGTAVVLAVLVAGCAGHHENVERNGVDDGTTAEPVEGSTGEKAGGEDGMAGGVTNGPEGRICGGIQGLPCDEGYFCEWEPGNCQAADLQGVCTAISEMCTKDYRPVCGCDGQTYSNDCMRRAAAVQKDHDGEC